MPIFLYPTSQTTFFFFLFFKIFLPNFSMELVKVRKLAVKYETNFGIRAIDGNSERVGVIG